MHRAPDTHSPPSKRARRELHRHDGSRHFFNDSQQHANAQFAPADEQDNSDDDENEKSEEEIEGDISFIMEEEGVSRGKAIRVLKDNGGDPDASLDALCSGHYEDWPDDDSDDEDDEDEDEEDGDNFKNEMLLDFAQQAGIPDPDDCVEFGKHSGRKYRSVWLEDRQYCEWCSEQSDPNSGMQMLLDFHEYWSR
jgi:hypothetical protein